MNAKDAKIKDVSTAAGKLTVWVDDGRVFSLQPRQRIGERSVPLGSGGSPNLQRILRGSSKLDPYKLQLPAG